MTDKKQLPPFDPDRKVSVEELRKSIEVYKAEYFKRGYSDIEIIKEANWLRRQIGLHDDIEDERMPDNMQENIKGWVQSYASGIFHVNDIFSFFQEYAKDPKKRQYVSKCLNRLCKTEKIPHGIIERIGKYGQFRRIEDDLERMDFIHGNEKPVDIWLPFELNSLVEVMPGNIILIAGEKGAGKTTISLNIAWANRKIWDVHYFNSEMGSSELKKVLLRYKDTDLMDWAQHISFYNRNRNFHDVIKTGPDKLNIIDFMEVAGDDYPMVGQWILNVHEKIVNAGAVTIICLQKPPGRDQGVGGLPTLDKPRLYLAVSRGKLKIVDGKNWASDENPRGMECTFKLVHGAQLVMGDNWGRKDQWSI